MSESNIAADKFVLLFSVDWFCPHWTLTGFVTRPEVATAFQQVMRDLVGSIMGDAKHYWDVSFSALRLGQTRDAFLEAVGRNHAPESSLGLIYALVAGEDSRDEMTSVSMAYWHNYEATIAEIGRADLAATEWDRHIVSLTPDLPTLLQNFVLSDLLGSW